MTSSGDDLDDSPGLGPDPASSGGRDGVEARMATMRQDFLDFFDAEFHALVRFVMRDGASLHDAQDTAQHAFTQGWAKVLRGEWEQVEQPRAWARVVALNHHRARQARRQELLVDPLPDVVAPGPGHAELTGQARDLVAALRLLDEDARAVLAFHLDDIPTAAIAAFLDISDQRARDLLKKARRTLKKHLAAPDQRSAGTASTAGPAGHEGRHAQ